MRAIGLFVAGIIVGAGAAAVLAQRADALADRRGVVMMNHVAINVPDLPERPGYYAAKMGYREAFRVNDAEGPAAAGLPADQQEHVSRAEPGQRPAARRLWSLRPPRRERRQRGRQVSRERA